ncbi:hypothetical protein GTW51_13285 [Aurantimonas aggregata]|uniref:Uncharacterized protein n=1 Tax=Aurantimonas aggregata TaxID=2047720 RepID=A0A6L9MIM6_9HYPH|nr:hypothetical protein [Aurantimonas aggregata]
MVRSWALTPASVTLRLLRPLAEVADLPPLPACGAISVRCWVPNLLIAEIFLRTEVRDIAMPFRKQIS